MNRRIVALIVKELLSIMKERRRRLMILIPPFVQLFVFGYAATFDLERVPYAVYNEDTGRASRELVASFEGSLVFRCVAVLNDSSRIEDLVNSKKALVVVRIGPQFTRNLLSNRQADVQVIVDGRNSNTALVALGYIRTIVDAYSRELAAHKANQWSPPRLVVRPWFNPNLESQWFIVPGIVGLLTLMVGMIVTALSVAKEREAGTFDQLLVTPLRPFDILVGKAAPGFLIGFGEATLIIIMAVVWFKIPLLGDLITLYLGLFLYLLSCIGMGLMISSIAVTQQQSLLGAFLFLVPSSILSGFATPIENMPFIVQKITCINPMRYFLVVVRSVFLEGASIDMLWNQLWPMGLIGLTTLLLAGFLFRHRLS